MHTKNLFVADDGSTLGVVDKGYRCIGVAYGWNEEPEYDGKGVLLNKLTSNEEARANAKLWAAADDLAMALQGFVSLFSSPPSPARAKALRRQHAIAVDALAKAGIE